MTKISWNRSSLDDLRREMDRLMQMARMELERQPAAHTATSFWTPIVDISETGEAILIDVELPGVQQQDIQLNLEGTTLVLKGERRFCEADGAEYHRLERTYGEFQRVFTLPINVQGDKVRAALKDGILRLTLPKVEAARPKQIQVNVEG